MSLIIRSRQAPVPLDEGHDVLFSVADDADELYDPNTPNPQAAGVIDTVHHDVLDGSHDLWNSDDRGDKLR